MLLLSCVLYFDEISFESVDAGWVGWSFDTCDAQYFLGNNFVNNVANFYKVKGMNISEKYSRFLVHISHKSMNRI